MCYQVQVIQHAAALPALEAGWTRLLLQSGNATPFASYQWNAAWWQHFGQGHRLYLLTVYDGAGTLAGIAPLMVRRRGPIRKLEFIGTGLSDRGDILVARGHAGPVYAALLRHLRAARDAWDLGDLSEVPPFSPLVPYLRAHHPRGLRVAPVPQTHCPVIDLPTSWETYVRELPRKRRYYVGSFPRKFLRDHAGRRVVVTAPGAVKDAVGTFYQLHLARWAVKQGELSADHEDPQFLPFLDDVCTRLAERGWLRIVQLYAGDQPVASSLNFLLNGRWHSYMKGFDPAWGHARPGTVLDALRIEQAITEQARQFDFGRGDESYKSGYGVTDEQNTRLLLGNGTRRSGAAFGIMALRISVRHFQERAAPATGLDGGVAEEDATDTVQAASAANRAT